MRDGDGSRRWSDETFNWKAGSEGGCAKLAPARCNLGPCVVAVRKHR